MNRKLLAAVIALAAFAAFLAIPIGEDSQSYAIGSDSELDVINIDEPYEPGQDYSLSGKSLQFASTGSLTIDSGYALVIDGPFAMSAAVESQDVIILMPGSSIDVMGQEFAIAERAEISLTGSMSFGYDYDLTEAGIGVTVSIDISDGGALGIMDGTIAGGADVEMAVSVSFGEIVNMSVIMNIPESTGTMPMSIVSSMIPDDAIPDMEIPESMEMSMVAQDIRADIVFSFDSANLYITDSSGAGPATMSVGTTTLGIDGMKVVERNSVMSISSDSDNRIGISMSVDSIEMSIEASEASNGASMDARVSDARIQASLSIADLSASTFDIEGSASFATMEASIADGNGNSISMSVADASASLSFGLGSDGAYYGEIGLDVDSAALEGTLVDAGIVEGTASGFNATLTVGDPIEVSASLSSAKFYAGAEGGDDPVTLLEVSDIDLAMSISSGVTEKATLDVGSFSYANDSGYYLHPVDSYYISDISVVYDGETTKATFSEASFTSASDLIPSFVESFTEGAITQDSFGMAFTAGEYRVDAIGVDGSTGYMTAGDYEYSFMYDMSPVVRGNFVFAFGPDNYAVLSETTFFDGDFPVFGEGSTVEFRDSYMISTAIVEGAEVSGTAYYAGDDQYGIVDIKTIQVNDVIYQMEMESRFDVRVAYDDDSIVSMTMILPQSVYVDGLYAAFEPYEEEYLDEESPYVPYTLNGDASEAVVALTGDGYNLLYAQLRLDTAEITINGETETYQMYDSIPVVATGSQEGMVFYGWDDGFGYYPAGSAYPVRGDATVADVWLPSEYSYSFADGVCTVDLADVTVFFIPDSTDLLTLIYSNGASVLTVVNDIGSVTVSAEDILPGVALEIFIAPYDRMLYAFMDEVVGDNPVYGFDAICGYASRIDASVTINSDSDGVIMYNNGTTEYGSIQSADGAISMDLPANERNDMLGLMVTGSQAESPDEAGGNTMMYIAIVVVVIVVIAVAAVVMMRRKNA